MSCTHSCQSVLIVSTPDKKYKFGAPFKLQCALIHHTVLVPIESCLVNQVLDKSGLTLQSSIVMSRFVLKGILM